MKLLVRGVVWKLWVRGGCEAAGEGGGMKVQVRGGGEAAREVCVCVCVKVLVRSV